MELGKNKDLGKARGGVRSITMKLRLPEEKKMLLFFYEIVVQLVNVAFTFAGLWSSSIQLLCQEEPLYLLR